MYTRPWGRHRMDRVKDLLEPLLRRNGYYLDLGCGLGRYTAWIADRVPDGFVHGVDISAEAIARAERRDNVRYYRASWDQHKDRLGLKYDLVLATEILEHAADPERLLGSFSGATLVVTVPCERPAPEENRWTPDGHGHLQSFDEARLRSLFKRIDSFDSDGRYFYVVGS